MNATISEHKLTESEHERLVKELGARNAEMEIFAYTISHDLKAPLVTILGFAKLLEKDIARADLENSADSVREVQKAAAGMQALIENLLQLARTGHIIGEPQEVNINVFLRELRARCAGHIEQSQATVVIAADFPVLRVDRLRFGEVFQNLVENALKYHRPGIHPRIEIGHQRAPGEVKLYVKDNGLGIKPEYCERIFGLFERVHTQVEGAGVGLAIARRIIQVHGGRLWVESEAGVGSTFWISLPDSAIVSRRAETQKNECAQQ